MVGAATAAALFPKHFPQRARVACVPVCHSDTIENRSRLLVDRAANRVAATFAVAAAAAAALSSLDRNRYELNRSAVPQNHAAPQLQRVCASESERARRAEDNNGLHGRTDGRTDVVPLRAPQPAVGELLIVGNYLSTGGITVNVPDKAASLCLSCTFGFVVARQSAGA